MARHAAVRGGGVRYVGAAGGRSRGAGRRDGRNLVDGAGVGWRLAGRSLTIRLAVPMATMFREAASPAWGSASIPVAVSCGDDASYGPRAHLRPEGTWADVVRAHLRVAHRARRIRVRFARDVTRRANQCRLDVRSPSGYGTHTAMTLRRGTAVGCVPNRREQVIVRDGRIRVMLTRQPLGEAGRQDAYRACVAPRQAPRAIEGGGWSGGGSGGGASRADRFRAAGTWLAWTTVSESNGLGPFPPTISAVDLAAAPRPVPWLSAGSGPGYLGGGRVVQLAVGSDGTLAWVVDQRADPRGSGQGLALLYTRTPAGGVTTLDAADTADALGAPAIAADHRTITWTNRGVPRSATLAP